MNKKLVALAVAGVLSAPLAAQAQTANVTLYGRVNMTVEAVQVRSQPEGVSEPWIYRVSSNSSRLGVRGTESLGGGLNAIFQIESSINGDAGGGTLAGRETFVGLQGGWGTVKIGNFLAPYDDIHPIFGNVPTLTTSILSTATIWAQGGQSKVNGGFDARLLVLDEPTLGLDLLYRREFYDTLLNDYFDKDRTILLTTHQVEEIENLVTDVLFIEQGRLVLDAAVEASRARWA